MIQDVPLLPFAPPPRKIGGRLFYGNSITVQLHEETMQALKNKNETSRAYLGERQKILTEKWNGLTSEEQMDWEESAAKSYLEGQNQELTVVQKAQ